MSALVKGRQLKEKHQSCEVSNEIENIIPGLSLISPNKVNVYEFNEKQSEISILEDYKGLPSDENLLNIGLD